MEISVVVPLFNEQENIPELYRRLTESLGALGLSYELVLVNDGSRDATAGMLDRLRSADPRVAAVHLSRNFGHQAAVCAGLDHAGGRAVIVMDGDLQDPPEALGEFIDAWRRGYEVVYAVRTKRKEHLLKRASYALFYRVFRAISYLDMPLDSGDFCLMDRKVVDVLKHLPEKVRFVRGLRAFVGFRQVGVRYERDARQAGKPKYTFRGLLRLALDGVYNFSTAPLALVRWSGWLLGLLALGLGGWWAVGAAVGGAPAWLPVGTLVTLVGTCQMLGMAILGEYLHRMFVEVKRRPTYIVRDQAAPAVVAREGKHAA